MFTDFYGNFLEFSDSKFIKQCDPVSFQETFKKLLEKKFQNFSEVLSKRFE
jgi:hypothetical protein